MITEIATHATEKSTYSVTVSFTDEAGDAVTPNSITWTLTDKDGTVINSRQDVSVTPATSVTITLSGDDLALQSGEVGGVVRVLTISATYDSDLGSNLPLKSEARFIVDDLKSVT